MLLFKGALCQFSSKRQLSFSQTFKSEDVQSPNATSKYQMTYDNTRDTVHTFSKIHIQQLHCDKQLQQFE